MHEAAALDGAGDFKIMKAVVLPLSKAIIAVLSLYYAVGHWNSYFNEMIYLSDRNKYPLQVFLREILTLSQYNTQAMEEGGYSVAGDAENDTGYRYSESCKVLCDRGVRRADDGVVSFCAEVFCQRRYDWRN
ncbi:MAG: hypothetical protein ACLR23_10045 [Clostridia bacterium]